jgi:DNA gyrase subunit A
MVTRDADAVEQLFVTNTHDNFFFFTNRGRVFQLKVYDVPDASRQAKGIPVVNMVQLEAGETVAAVQTIPAGRTTGYLVMATINGTVKRTDLEQFKNVRRTGLRAITLDEDDDLAWRKLAKGDEDIMLVTAKGNSIRFPQEQVRPMGREAAGVKGISLGKGDTVILMDLIGKTSTHLLTITEHGFGKRSPLEEYKIQRRSGQGMSAAKLNAKTGALMAARVVSGDDSEVILMSSAGLATRTEVTSIRQTGRATQGVIVMRLNRGDTVCSMAPIARDESED